MSLKSKLNRKGPIKNLRPALQVEPLEERTLMTCNVISGYVYYDVNNNGTYQQGLEPPIANSPIELRDANGVVVGTTTTDATGHYEFEIDEVHLGNETQETAVKIIDFPTTPTPTNYSGLTAKIGQFDSTKGVLQSVEIIYGGTITSTISGVNVSPNPDPHITGTVSGQLFLTAPGVANDSFSVNAEGGEVFNTPANGAFNLGTHSATGSKTVTVTGSDLNAYIGTGTVDVVAAARGRSVVDGGGYLDSSIRTTGISTVTVIYHYKPYECLEPGDYVVRQTTQPDGYVDGRESQGTTVIPDAVATPNHLGTDEIHVHLVEGVDSVNNNFGEVKKTQLSGHVWYDRDNDGIRENNEAPIVGAVITLEGPGGPRTTTTNDQGYYEFLNLDPGTYTVKEAQPTPYLDGKDNEGTLGGTVINQGDVIAQGPNGQTATATEDRIQSITLQAGDNSENNDFGEIKPASISGYVWWDKNNDGVRDANEPIIRNATVTLTGFDDQGPVMKSKQTDENGFYKFDKLRPGTYSLHESQPAGYRDGKDSIGSPGGTQSNDAFDNIVLPVEVDGVNNDFGEIKVTTPDTPLPKTQNLVGYLPIISKTQRTTTGNMSNIPPALRSQMQFVVAANVTLTGRQPNASQTAAGATAINRNTPAQVRNYIQQLWVSAGHRSMQVTELYQDVLNRAPTAQEKSDMIARLNAGENQLVLLEELYLSNEYQTLNGTGESLAKALSRDILNVIAGTTSTEAIVQSMETQPLNVVIHDLLMSDASLANLIDDAYRETLRRPASAVEIQRFTPQIRAGTLTLDELAQQLLASNEFQTLASNRIR